MALNVIFASSEAVPFSKTGGLADVSGSLPGALGKLGCGIIVILPFYRETASGGFAIEDTGLAINVPVGARALRSHILKSQKDSIPVYFIKCNEYFDRSGIYGTPEGDYFDNLERFSFFSRAVIEAAKAVGFKPDIIHCNDWQTGLIAAYIKDTYKDDPFFSGASTLFTVHNLAYQGIFPAALYEITGLSGRLFTHEGLEFWGKFSTLKAGIVYSDAINTVSRKYSAEIQTPEYGCGLDGVLQHRKDVLYGILNGVDYGVWNPETDALIPANYSVEDLGGKGACKKELLKAFNLKIRSNTPLVGMVSRLDAQKGFDILSEAMPDLMKLGARLVILGSGSKKYKELIEGLALQYPKKLSVRVDVDDRLAHLIEAGSDIFLMPSRYEPCGLNQIYSLKYGTIPVVRATGGLDDTVRDYSSGGETATGFKFNEYSSKALVQKVKEAVSVYKDKNAWYRLIKNSMKEHFSWDDSARKYLEVYKKIKKEAGKLPKN